MTGDSLAGDRPVNLAMLDESLRTEFQEAWRNGQDPKIESFLERVEMPAREAALRELIVLEIELRMAAGQGVALDEYRKRFPEYRTAVENGWALAELSLVKASVPLTASFSETEWRRAAGTENVPEVASETGPDRIVRYAIRKVLGKGGFAIVYLAHDTELNRLVALKVPRADYFGGQQELESFLDEARKAAQLDHPAIVRIHDVQKQQNAPYIVEQYVAGQDLATLAKTRRFSLQEIVGLVTGIAEAIGYAHQRGFVHRDLKPANIVVDEAGNPHVMDFGLAVHSTDQYQRRGERAGTYPYMSPEQVRGEVHRLDGRSDIWSLGVILYELLTGCRPFSAADREELFDEIEHRDPRPPRQLSPAVPRELSRICLACLTKRATDRYESAGDLIEDLRHWQEGTSARSDAIRDEKQVSDKPSPSAPKIVPKGLRSYDASDADFFLDLLPGPRDRDGLPKSIRFWKNRIECIDVDDSFVVGVIYGPSGCGKSSFMKAGLLPRLAPHVWPVYVEATGNGTEVRLLHVLRKHNPQLPTDLNLAQTLRWFRDQPWAHKRKILLVLDQFEQWLHVRGGDNAQQLVDALRQCDGACVQCIVMVRDDFWLAISRFMRDLEVPLVEGNNSALVDLFDTEHAKKVLIALGRAFQRLPEGMAELSEEQTEFIGQSIAGLSENGKVICVRLALFAEMMQGKPWTINSLRKVGGAAGVGFTFLEETFSASTAAPLHRLHQEGARAVLKALLPEAGTDIKGSIRSENELLCKSGYGNRLSEFADLLRMLDRELRLITPTDLDGRESDAATTTFSNVVRHYQLTHDYLVPSLRDWLTFKQRQTWRGRAELRLAERSAFWTANRENRHLPSWWEFLNIRLFTNKQNWTDLQRAMMHMAAWVHGLRSGTAIVLMLLAATGALILRPVRNSADGAGGAVAFDELELTWVFADLVMFAAYAAIPLAILFSVLRRREVPVSPFWVVLVVYFCVGAGVHLFDVFGNVLQTFTTLMKIAFAFTTWIGVLVLYPMLSRLLKVQSAEEFEQLVSAHEKSSS